MTDVTYHPNLDLKSMHIFHIYCNQGRSYSFIEGCDTTLQTSDAKDASNPFQIYYITLQYDLFYVFERMLKKAAFDQNHILKNKDSLLAPIFL